MVTWHDFISSILKDKRNCYKLGSCLIRMLHCIRFTTLKYRFPATHKLNYKEGCYLAHVTLNQFICSLIVKSVMFNREKEPESCAFIEQVFGENPDLQYHPSWSSKTKLSVILNLWTTRTRERKKIHDHEVLQQSKTVLKTTIVSFIKHTSSRS